MVTLVSGGAPFSTIHPCARIDLLTRASLTCSHPRLPLHPHCTAPPTPPPHALLVLLPFTLVCSVLSARVSSGAAHASALMASMTVRRLLLGALRGGQRCSCLIHPRAARSPAALGGVHTALLSSLSPAVQSAASLSSSSPASSPSSTSPSLGGAGATRILNGKAAAASMCSDIRRIVDEHRSRHSQGDGSAAAPRPGLAVILAGERRDSLRYVQRKTEKAEELGFHSQLLRLPSDCSEEQLLDAVHRLNADERVHGILVQLPLPPHIRKWRVLQAVRVDKDVDGFHPLNMGSLALNMRGAGVFVPWDDMQRSIHQQQQVQPSTTPLTATDRSGTRGVEGAADSPLTSFTSACPRVQSGDSALRRDEAAEPELRQLRVLGLPLALVDLLSAVH